MSSTTMVYGCKTQGASVWTEIWCEQKPSDAAVPTTKSRFGCSVDATPGADGAGVATLALLMLGGLRRRRVSRRA
jgi:MYXO-CTERM domain-containing protein